MSDPAEDVRSIQVDAAIAVYLAALKRGAPPDRAVFLTEHAEIAGELEEFLADYDAFVQAAPRPAELNSTDRIANSTGRNGRDGHLKLPLPRAFGNFELMEEIARGGMGVVYKARQLSPSRAVALKMILAGQLASKSDVERFYAEAQAAAALDHPHIVPIFEVGECDGQHYFTMALVEGESLAQRLANGPLPAREAAAIIRDVALAVHYAHEHGIIHRDLKPANILLDAEGRVRVTDFGLAKRQTEDGGLTRTGELLGTPSFMSPEQVTGDPKRIGPMSDVYSLGATLYALVTGRPPFQAAITVDTLKQVVDQEPVPPRELDPSIPRDLETITLKCLEKDRSRRYSNPRELSDDLQRYLNDEPVKARPPSAVYQIKKFVRRNFAAVMSTAAIVVVIVIGLTATTYLVTQQRDIARNAADQANQERQRAETNLQTARSAVDKLFTNVAQELEHKPKMEQIRRRLLEDALEFYQGFLQQKSSDPNMRRETAQAYYRVGAIQEMLGNGPQSEAALRQAVALLEKLVVEFPAVPEYREDLLGTRGQLCTTLLWANKRR